MAQESSEIVCGCGGVALAGQKFCGECGERLYSTLIFAPQNEEEFGQEASLQ